MDALLGRLQDALITPAEGDGARGPLTDALLLRAVDKAEKCAGEALAASQALGAVSAQQRGAIDTVADRARLLRARGQEAGSVLGRAESALEQVKLIALNTGLEGARQGEARGRALVQIAEEIRSCTVAAQTALGELYTMRQQIDQEQHRLSDEIAACQNRSAELSQELLKAQAAGRDANVALGELSQSLRRNTKTDPETARLLTDVADHARALVSALSELSAKPQRGFLLKTIAPSLRPLLRFLSELERRSGESE